MGLENKIARRTYNVLRKRLVSTHPLRQRRWWSTSREKEREREREGEEEDGVREVGAGYDRRVVSCAWNNEPMEQTLAVDREWVER